MISEEILKKIKPGARVRVFSTVEISLPTDKEKKSGSSKKERSTSAFEGIIIARKHGSESGATITVRRVLAGIGVERIFPLHSPTISKIEVLNSPKKIHRSKLYFIRKESDKTIRKKLGVSV